MFNKNSGLVKIWITLIQTNQKTLNDVPAISNLREIVTQLVEGDVDG